MRYVKSDQFNKFHCIAHECPKTCCSGWQIMIDEASMEKYDRYEGDYRDVLHRSINREEECFHQRRNGDCAFLNSNKLCEMIIHCGEDMLCDTCRLYPRHAEEYPDLREWCLSISCPEAARMLTAMTDHFDLLMEEDDEPDPLEEEFDDFDYLFFSRLEDSREAIFMLIRGKNVPFTTKLRLILELSRELQLAYDEGDYEAVDKVIDDFGAISGTDSDPGFSIREFLSENRDVLDQLVRLDPEWHSYLLLLDDYFRIPDPEELADIQYDFMHDGSKFFEIEGALHSVIQENLLLSYLYTYYLGSVYNGMVYAYAKICIFAVLVIDALAIGLSVKNHRPVSLKEYTEIIYRFDREIEHSEDNVSTLLDTFDL